MHWSQTERESWSLDFLSPHLGHPFRAEEGPRKLGLGERKRRHGAGGNPRARRRRSSPRALPPQPPPPRARTPPPPPRASRQLPGWRSWAWRHTPAGSCGTRRSPPRAASARRAAGCREPRSCIKRKAHGHGSPLDLPDPSKICVFARSFARSFCPRGAGPPAVKLL